MNRNVLMSSGLAAAVVLAVFGCSSSTRLTTVWSDPASQPGSLRKLMVVNVAKTATIRRAFEDQFAAVLNAQGIDAEPSYRLVADGALDSAEASIAMHRSHCDGVFVTRILDQITVKTYYPPTSAYRTVPSAYHGGWYDYYSRGYSYVTVPGYTVENQLVNMETNLYRVSDGALVWSALSRTWLQQSETPGDETNDVVRELVRGLSKTNIISRRAER